MRGYYGVFVCWGMEELLKWMGSPSTGLGNGWKPRQLRTKQKKQEEQMLC